MPILLALFFAFALITPAQSMENSQPAAASAVVGDIMYWEGDELIVKVMSGDHFRVHVTPETKIEGAAGRLKAGDKIAAQVNSDGHARTITLQIPGSGGSMPPPGSR